VTSTGADGTFRLEGVPPGTYVLTARPPGAPPIYVRASEARDRDTTDVGSLGGGSTAARIFGNVVGPDGRVKARGERSRAVQRAPGAGQQRCAGRRLPLEALAARRLHADKQRPAISEPLRFSATPRSP